MMNLAFLDNLPLSKAQREKLRGKRRYETAAAFYRLCRILPGVVIEQLDMNPGNLDGLIRALEVFVPHKERQAVQSELAAMGS
ncbi:MAG: hypothetical protein K2X93_08000 [Candidatus Obscuribacterales bacterium]|nr:hypothetical protein [Candidatus Obscuribacterales bacterium]